MGQSPKSTATLVSLPVEIKQKILISLSDLRVLQVAVKAHSSLKDALKDCSTSIIKRILFHTLPRELFPEAFAVQASKYLETTNEESVKAFLCDYFRSLTHSSQRLKFQDALAIEDFYHVIKSFCDTFAAIALSRHPVTGEYQKDRVQPSRNERCRIEQSFYRFELYSNIFRPETKQGNPIIDKRKQHDLFFSQFASWENEQLMCVHDYLLRLLE